MKYTRADLLHHLEQTLRDTLDEKERLEAAKILISYDREKAITVLEELVELGGTKKLQAIKILLKYTEKPKQSIASLVDQLKS